jgi:hypothetical protein
MFTNRQVHEEAAGMSLDNTFFSFNGIDADAICDECKSCVCSGCKDNYCKTEACYESCTYYGKPHPYKKCPNEDD